MRAPLAAFALLAACASEQDLVGSQLPPVQELLPPPATPDRTDRYVQTTQPEVDILWVVDNSTSMSDEQQAITSAFPTFMNFFLGSGLDYHIGVVSTDMTDPDQSGRLIEAQGIRWIDPTTADPVGVFSEMANLGTGGAHMERGIQAAWASLEIETAFNDGFYRDQSAVHFVVLSDEDDQTSSGQITTDEFIDYLGGLRTDEEQVSFSSIVSPPPPAFPCEGASSTGTRYLQVTSAIGGVKWSICDRDWGAVLEQLGLQTVGLKREYFLSEKPVLGSIDVSVTDPAGTDFEFSELDTSTGLGDWTYDETRNSVTFVAYYPPEGSTVAIHYDVLSAVERE